MKSFLSLSIVCLYLGSNVANALVVREDTGFVIPGGIESHFPTHIVKLKARNVQNITNFESNDFINHHYSTFQTMRGSLQGKFDIKGASLHAESEDLEPRAVKNIDIGNEFKAVVGSFNPSFVNYLSQLEDVEYVETNQVYKAAILPTVSKPQPYISSQVSSKNKRNIITQINVPSWGLARINRRNKDDMTTYSVDESAGGGVHVYVFDSGINADHPDFAGRASMEASFIDYEDNVDYAGHGTHVAGTIGGNSYGVAKNAILHGVKILDRNGDGTTSALIQAISHVTQIAIPGRSIINLSLTGPRSQTIDDALSMAVQQHGIPIFVSAGNSGDNACDYSPSANPDVFTVGASNQNDIIPSFSSYGECVRIYAPGTNITSSWLGSESQTMDGTSMANPHVTGIAAMLMSEYDFHSASELYEAIMNIATENVLTSSIDDDGSERLLAYNGPERF
ncbi:uncharacterized protein ATC70_007728 [Mucor velutinosus]|uniref:Peptidase S8/S53 domain-containing protein n=1 Tax=Mucor velutinosus TaxID=708070 RepID=A0AAN7HW49_9FUNG|nr:hypothetical protein ATC70_007728 [Mucor velutinosus]